jgi:hypothetical protein
MHRLHVLVLLLAAAVCVVPAAFAGNPAFNKGPSYNATVTALTASGKATGLGNSATAAFLTASEVDVFYQCKNNGGNFVPGHPATFTGVAGPTQNISPHNGQITFNVSLPAPVVVANKANCGSNGNWTVVVSRVDYLGVTLHIQQDSTDILTDHPNDFTAP